MAGAAGAGMAAAIAAVLAVAPLLPAMAWVATSLRTKLTPSWSGSAWRALSVRIRTASSTGVLSKEMLSILIWFSFAVRRAMFDSLAGAIVGPLACWPGLPARSSGARCRTSRPRGSCRGRPGRRAPCSGRGRSSFCRAALLYWSITRTWRERSSARSYWPVSKKRSPSKRRRCTVATWSRNSGVMTGLFRDRFGVHLLALGESVGDRDFPAFLQGGGSHRGVGLDRLVQQGVGGGEIARLEGGLRLADQDLGQARCGPGPCRDRWGASPCRVLSAKL